MCGRGPGSGRRLPWGGADRLDSPPTTLPAAPHPAGLGAGIPRTLGSSEMALVSASGDRMQGVGAGSELNLLDGGVEPCGGGPSPAGQPPGLPWKPHGAAQRVSLQKRAKPPSTSHFPAFHQVPARLSRKWAKGQGGSEGGVQALASLTSAGHPWGRWDRTWPLLPVQPHPGPSGDCPEAQNPSLTEPDHFLSPPCISEPPWTLVKKEKRHPTLELPLQESPGNPDALPGLKTSSPGHLTRFIGGDPEAECPGSPGPCGCLIPSPVSFPSVLPPEGRLVSIARISEPL